MTRARELDTVRLQGKRFRTADLEVRHVASLLRHPRVGIIVPKYSHDGVDRNRVKRRLREVVRLDMLPHLAPMDLVIRALPSAYHASYDVLRDQCLRLRDRAGTGVA